MIYLALYKGRKSGRTPKALVLRMVDWIIRRATRSAYSHCEIAVWVDDSDGLFECYSSSFRDGGVRCKEMRLPSDKWDLAELPDTPGAKLELIWQMTRGKQYDLLGALCVKTLFRKIQLKQSDDKWFCSEWCAAVMGVQNPSLYSPEDLAVLSK